MKAYRAGRAGMRGRVALGVCFLAVAALAEVAPAVEINRIIATIDGDPVTRYEVEQFVRRQARGRLPEDYVFDPAPVLEAYLLEKIVEKQVVEKGISVHDEDIDRYIETIRTRNQLAPETLREAVAAQGLTWEQYRQQVRQEIEKAQLINLEVRGKVNVTPEDIERYYEAHKQEYALPRKVHLRHIVLRLPADASPAVVEETMGRARGVHRRLEDGDDFEDLAREVSEDAAAESGGDLGFVAREELFEELQQVVDELGVGEHSEPVRTSVGVHLVKVVERREATFTPLEEVADGIKEQLYAEALESRYERLVTEDLRKRHHVEVLE